MERRTRILKRMPRWAPTHCAFCESKTEPDYKEPSGLTKYVTERGKIIPAERSGLCARHQRKLTIAIKRARMVALMPFVVRA